MKSPGLRGGSSWWCGDSTAEGCGALASEPLAPLPLAPAWAYAGGWYAEASGSGAGALASALCAVSVAALAAASVLEGEVASGGVAMEWLSCSPTTPLYMCCVSVAGDGEASL